MTGRECGAGYVSVFAVVETGTLTTGFVGPIPYGCQIVSKTQMGVEMGGFERVVVCK